MFELQDDENKRLDLQERQQGDDNSDGRVKVSSVILIAGGVAGGGLTVQEHLTCGDAGREALRNQMHQCTNVVNVQGKIEQPKDSMCVSEELYGDALASPSLGERAPSWWPRNCRAHLKTLVSFQVQRATVRPSFIAPGTSRAVMTQPSRMLSYHGRRIFFQA